MPIDDLPQENVQLSELNEELNYSLARCHELVDDYRTKLVANSDEPMLLRTEERDAAS